MTIVQEQPYQSSNAPHIVHLCHIEEDNASNTKTFMLDDGRLQLQPVKQAFALLTVELIIGKINKSDLINTKTFA